MKTFKTLLDACINRYTHQLERLTAFTTVVQSALDENTDSKNVIGAKAEKAATIEVFQEACIILIATYLEEYLTSLVSVAIIDYEDMMREYLRREGSPEEKKHVENYHRRQLVAAGVRRVSFKDRAKRLERIFDVLFGCSPWPDTQTASVIRDLVRVRNILVHSGGWPEFEHYKDMETSGVVVSTKKTDDPEEIEFFELRLHSLLPDSLKAILAQARYIQGELEKNDLYKL
jgi:hypothetical protein